ncbi:MAG TPA: hypothetical protein VL522_03090 [Bordetella sp.]|nr:hypothetical protein [Bordetella sp.]
MDSFLGALDQIIANFVGEPDDARVKRFGAKNIDTHDANGAPRLAAPDQPSEPRVTAPTPLNLGFLLSQVQGLRSEANGALVNDNTNSFYNQTKNRVDKFMEAQLGSIKEFEKKAAEFVEKAGKWYNRVANWAAETLGPYMPYIGFAIAAVATVATGGAAWPMLALAGVGLANSVLKKFDIDAVAGVSAAIKSTGKVVSEKGANALADTVAAVMGLLLADPNPMAKLCGSIAKACGASKATVDRVEFWGQIIGMAVVVVGHLALTWGGTAVNAITKLASNASSFAGSVASNVTSTVAEGLKKFVDSVQSIVAELMQFLRESMSRLNELSAVFKDAMQALKDTASGALKGTMTTTRNAAVKLQPKLDVGAKIAQSASNGTNGMIGGGNGWRDYELGRAQYGIDVASADRRQTEQLLGITRDQMHDMDDGTKLSLEKVAQNLKANADMIRNYSSEIGNQAAIQIEQMSA